MVSFQVKMLFCFQRNFCAFSSPLVPVQLPSPMELIFGMLCLVKSKVSLLSRYMEILSPTEKENILCMPGDQLQKRALLVRTLVRTTIARYQIHCHVDPRSLKFWRNIHGKPEVEWQSDDGWSPPPLHFNISHTSSLIACVVTTNSQDAYVKALGKGFSAMPFKTFTIHVKSAATRGIFPPEDLDYEASQIVVESSDDPSNLTSTWQFALLELACSHYAAICMEKDNTGEGGIEVPIKLTPWKTIPFVEDEFRSGTDTVVPIGLLKQF